MIKWSSWDYGTVHSFSGANDIDSLCLAQSQVLVAITAATIQRLPQIKDAVRKWAKDLQQLERFCGARR